MANSHYISRFLTRPWEHEKRKLTYYSFDDEQIRTDSSKRLYAIEGLFEDSLESFLNARIEDISAKERTAIVEGKTDLSKWKSFQALFLLTLLQGGRTASALSKNSSTFAKILTLTDDDITSLVIEARKRFQLVSINCPTSNRLFFPDTGTFPAICTGNGMPTTVICLPFGPTTALALVPQGADISIVQPLATGAFLTNYSISPNARRVVIHPDVFRAMKKDDLIKAIKNLRRQSSDLVSQVNELNDLSARVSDLLGVLP